MMLIKSILLLAVLLILFAVYEIDGEEEELKYYLVMDNDNYLYIIYMKDSEYKKLNVDSIETNPIKVKGLTKKIPNDIKELAIESYNEIMKELSKRCSRKTYSFCYGMKVYCGAYGIFTAPCS